MASMRRCQCCRSLTHHTIQYGVAIVSRNLGVASQASEQRLVEVGEHGLERRPVDGSLHLLDAHDDGEAHAREVAGPGRPRSVPPPRGGGGELPADLGPPPPPPRPPAAAAPP